VRELRKYYPVRGGLFGGKLADVKAVESVSLDVDRGETLGLVGESGCGKSTLGRTVMRLEEPTAGEVRFDNRDLAHASKRELFELRRDVQMIFQDPYSSLNPRLTIGEIVREPLDVHRQGVHGERVERVEELLEAVGLQAAWKNRYPHELSGGQRQRVGVARSLALGPRLIIADEPVSALDVSVQGQILNLMVQFQRELSLTYIFISHDLSVVEYISDRVAIMYLGRIVEQGSKATIFTHPGHPYTRALIDAVPVAHPSQRRQREPISGESPSAVDPPPGCAFHPRCPLAIDACRELVPALEPTGGDDDHLVACHRTDEV
jgi:peptide/nickel transport system ATP-binding protein/oligopeptide transport system ATP-binding protein